MFEKNRHWTFLVYPESCPDNWKDILQETGCGIAISPLHEFDENPDGTIKKPHYHVIICFPGPTTFSKVNSICSMLNSPIPKRILSVIGIYRYFTHKDNPEKYQYNEEDIVVLNGFDIADISGMTTTETLAIKKEIQKLIINNKIFEYSDLMDFILEHYSNDFYRVASDYSHFFDKYITSKRNKMKETLQNSSFII